MLYFIVNRGSGAGKSKAVWRQAKKCMIDSGIEYKAYGTKYKGHATQIADMLCQLPVDKVSIVIIGGDGTIHEVLNGITDFQKVRIGIIPAGSGNDFARGLKIGHDAKANVTQIAIHDRQDNIRNVDLGCVLVEDEPLPRVFGISSGLGMDAIVCKKVENSMLKKILNKLHMGKLCYVAMTIYTLFSMDTADFQLEFGRNGDETSQKMRAAHTMKSVIFLAAMNLRAEGGGVPMAPNAKPDDGVLSFSSASGIAKWKTFFCLPFLVAGKQKWIKGFEVYVADYVLLHTSKPVTLHADGEYLGEFQNVKYQSLPGLLQILN